MKYLLTIVLLFSFSQVRAGNFYTGRTGNFYTGNELLERCEARFSDDTAANISKANTCFGYVVSVSDIHDTYVGFKLMEQLWCMPENLEGLQLVRIVTKYLQDAPEDLHNTASSLVSNALISAFPCE